MCSQPLGHTERSSSPHFAWFAQVVPQSTNTNSAHLTWPRRRTPPMGTASHSTKHNRKDTASIKRTQRRLLSLRHLGRSCMGPGSTPNLHCSLSKATSGSHCGYAAPSYAANTQLKGHRPLIRRRHYETHSNNATVHGRPSSCPQP